jgi:Domain of unknown function (DUF4907)
MTIRNKYSLIGITALLVCFAVIFFSRQKTPDRKIYVHAEAVQTVYGWGYNILADDKIYIKQEFIPGVAGKLGFKSREDALKVGNLVVKKISLNQSHSVSASELDSLGISVK